MCNRPSRSASTLIGVWLEKGKDVGSPSNRSWKRISFGGLVNTITSPTHDWSWPAAHGLTPIRTAVATTIGFRTRRAFMGIAFRVMSRADGHRTFVLVRAGYSSRQNSRPLPLCSKVLLQECPSRKGRQARVGIFALVEVVGC